MTRRLAQLIVLALVGTGATAFADGLPPLPGPAPRPLGPHSPAQRVSRNSSCVACHPDIAAEWATSLHKRAWVDPVFLSAFQIEPMAFCSNCHAPERRAAGETPALDDPARELGVGCVTCHVESGEVVGAHATSEAAMHPVLADARLATPAACASCHQFDFPSEAHQISPQPMQDTVSEHARSSAKDTPCQRCHMPTVDGPDGRHKSHAFSVIGDPGMVRRAVDVSAARLDERTLAVTLTPAQVGHAFPTGDLFRRLVVRAQAVDARGRVLAHAPAVLLARSFVDEPRDPHGADLTFQRVEAEDTRVPPPGVAPPPRIVLAQPAARADSRLRYQVVYQRMSTPMANAFRVSQVLDEIIVAEGELPPSVPRPLAANGARR